MSLSNLAIEISWITIASILVPWILWLFFRFQAKRAGALSFVLTLLPIIAAITVRLTIPTLPE